ncbi:MAG: NAD(P)-dependent oxidoreductase, partial [Geminicoccaceae bacterium]
ETQGLIGRELLLKAKPGLRVINVARGGIVDEAALAEALRTGRLAGAALDVFEEEPLSKAAAERLRGLPNLLLSPHVAGPTVESNVRVSALVADKVSQALAGG